MNELSQIPIRVAYSREEMMILLEKWMIQEFGVPRERMPEGREQWYRDEGLIAHFIRSHFPTHES